MTNLNEIKRAATKMKSKIELTLIKKKEGKKIKNIHSKEKKNDRTRSTLISI